MWVGWAADSDAYRVAVDLGSNPKIMLTRSVRWTGKHAQVMVKMMTTPAAQPVNDGRGDGSDDGDDRRPVPRTSLRVFTRTTLARADHTHPRGDIIKKRVSSPKTMFSDRHVSC